MHSSFSFRARGSRLEWSNVPHASSSHFSSGIVEVTKLIPELSDIYSAVGEVVSIVQRRQDSFLELQVAGHFAKGHLLYTTFRGYNLPFLA